MTTNMAVSAHCCHSKLSSLWAVLLRTFARAQQGYTECEVEVSIWQETASWQFQTIYAARYAALHCAFAFYKELNWQPTGSTHREPSQQCGSSVSFLMSYCACVQHARAQNVIYQEALVLPGAVSLLMLIWHKDIQAITLPR